MADEHAIFPDITPSSVKKGMFRVIVRGDLSSNADIQQLILLMFQQPECAYYYFAEYRTLPDAPLKLAEDSGDILVEETVMFYYEHPKIGRDFVHIEARDGNFQWDWQRDVVEKGPMFMRSTLRLSERKKRQLETLEKIEIEENAKEQRLAELYNYDVFLSYALVNSKEAEGIYRIIEANGGTVFMSEKSIQPGDDFVEEIRLALIGSRQLWLLLSPDSIKSEWVISEWGAAWVLKKKIVPILFRCGPDALPARLKGLHAADYHKVSELVETTFSAVS